MIEAPDRLKGRDFTRVEDWSRQELEAALDLADELKRAQAQREPHELLPGRTLAMIFQKPSTRTRVSFEVGSRDATLDFEIPSDGKLFRYLLLPQIHYHLAADLRSTIKCPNSYEIRLSDKGRYLSGILDLSHALKETLYLFEHPFWRSLFQELSKREPSKQLMEKLTSDVKQLMQSEWSMDRAALACISAAIGLTP